MSGANFGSIRRLLIQSDSKEVFWTGIDVVGYLRADQLIESRWFVATTYIAKKLNVFLLASII